jgi:hypothetical protein
MGKAFDHLHDDLAALITKQPVFFVATAPSEGGHVNVSPKGLDSFRVLGPKTVAYLDLTGSGVETIAHLRQNGRITLMFCTFTGPPSIVRLYGRGEAFAPGEAEFDALAPRFVLRRGARAIVRVALERVSTSCGYAVPLMDFVGERDVLDTWTAKKDDEALDRYRAEKNAVSIDGLPGLKPR